MEKTFLLPGEWLFTKVPTTITTVLGSCVAIALWDRNKHIGGLNHYLMPSHEGSLPGGKIGDFAIRALIKDAIKAGSLPKDLQAKIYGGANIITSFNAKQDVGQKNILKAHEILMQMKIPFRTIDVGGQQSRILKMNTETGEVDSKCLDREQGGGLSKSFAGNKAKVLVVDDSSMVRKIVCRAIADNPFLMVCGEAGDAYEAREQIIACDPDVICLDIMMPKMNGLDFLKRIMYYKPIPTVVLSTLVREGNQLWTDLKRAGALGLVNKDDMKIYENGDNLKEVLLPKLLLAAKTRVAKRAPQ